MDVRPKIKIGIVGNGFVGKATQLLGRLVPAKAYKTNIETMVYDIRPEACVPLGTTLGDLEQKCDLIFICLPTPLNHDGSCYTAILEETVAKINHPFKIVRSTVSVGFSEKHKCYFMPEFLTEANWERDFINTKTWYVGIPSSILLFHTQLVHMLEFKRKMNFLLESAVLTGAIYYSNVEYMTTGEAEMLKLMKNCFLSAKVGIMNEFYDLCEHLNVNYARVIKAVGNDPRIGATHMMVPGPDGRRGFGGTCFPKDTHSLYYQFNNHGVDSVIFPAVLYRNDAKDRTEKEWVTDVWRTTLPRPAIKRICVVVGNRLSAKRRLTEKLLLDNVIVIYVIDNLVRNEDTREPICDERFEHKEWLDKLTVKWGGNDFMVKYADTSKPLFFPRVDYIYYLGFDYTTPLYSIQHQMLTTNSVIDLWKTHPGSVLVVFRKVGIKQCLVFDYLPVFEMIKSNMILEPVSSNSVIEIVSENDIDDDKN
jgi:hypothetical protein